MNQGPQGLWLGPKGPTDGTEGCSLQQELEKAREVNTHNKKVFWKVYLHCVLEYII